MLLKLVQNYFILNEMMTQLNNETNETFHSAAQVLRWKLFLRRSNNFPLLWNQNVHYRVHKRPPPDPNL